MNISRWLSRIAISLAFVSPSAFAQQNDNDLSAVFGDGPDLLSPDVAFQGQLTHADGELTLAFDIAEGYYLYRDKFALAPNDNSVQLGEPEWPQADIYEDPYFGDSAIYRHAFSATVPVKAASSEKTEVSVTYQGCADIGVCFPPTTKTFALANLVAAASAPSTTLKLDGTSNSILDVLKSHSNSTSADSSSDNALSFGSNNDTLLSPAEAYRPFVETTAQGLRVVWAIEPGYYLKAKATSH